VTSPNPPSTRVTVTVDGRPLEVEAGITILQALLQEGIAVPALCNDVRLDRSNGNCGLCVVDVGGDEVKACITPMREGMVIATHSPAIDAYRKVRVEQLLGDHNADCLPPCQQACPARIDIQRYLALVADGNLTAALRVIKDNNPFPSACGRVCPHPCELACRRNLVDQPVAINAVKRFAADRNLFASDPWAATPAPPTGKRIAVVGAGPSGLSAAYYLALAGHGVTVFDQRSKPGGMMRYGIPEYRLPKATLDAEIKAITDLGVRLHCGKALGTHIRLEDLHADFDAVYLAIGSWRATTLHLDGENLGGVWGGINYLRAVAGGTDPDLGAHVVVVGGGNTAIDCARTALRRGARVTLLYRRTRHEMPAQPYEVEEALAEGVEMMFLTAPGAISRADGQLALTCLRMELGEPDRSGRRRPVPLEGSEFTLTASTIIGAIGQSTDTQFLYNDLPVRLGRHGDIEIDEGTRQTSEEGIFAGGDCVTGPATVIEAVAAGKKAATAIDEYVTKGYVRVRPTPYNCSRGRLEDLPRDEFEALDHLPRHRPGEIGLDERLTTFHEVEQVLSEPEARAEAARCLKCGCKERFVCDLRRVATDQHVVYSEPLHTRPRLPVLTGHPFIVRDHNKCISCGRCVAACSEIEGPGVLAYQFHGGVLRVGTKTDQPLIETDCVSCGQCVTACPCGALDYVRERPDVFSAINDPTKLVVGFVAPSPRSYIAHHYGVPFDQASGFIAALLRALGFDRVFDFSFAADLTIMEETTEFLDRIASGGVMPQFTSCCPGWVNLVEKRYPELIPHLSSCKSPQQMMGATVKNHFAALYGVPLEDLYVVSIVPCLAKKYEAARPEFAPGGVRDVDAVLTTSEFIEMITMVRIDPTRLEPEAFDEPYARVTGAGVLFGASGGVAEAALRMAVEQLTGTPLVDHLEFTEVRGFEHLKEAQVEAGGKTVRVAVISGLANAEPLVRRVVAGEDVGYDLVEIMACPGGCISGAGNPPPQTASELPDRQAVLVNIDRTSQYRKSQENPDILRLYHDYYGRPNSDLAHALLHTHYAPFHAPEAVR
jgi:formate dehydrogenase major subunit